MIIQDVALRIRKARDVASPRVQSLALIGVTGGLLTPREIKEICQAVIANAKPQPAKPTKANGADRRPSPPPEAPHRKRS